MWTAAAVAGALRGAGILRVHDVAAIGAAILVADQLCRA
jgi:dihydropteroate synthase